MVYNEIIKGRLINLHAVSEDDVQFILSLRLDPMLNRYLNKVENNLQKQINWIKTQHAKKGDYYFLVKRKDKTPIGTISLYNIDNQKGEFGRWIIIGNSIETLESVILIHEFGFNKLHLKCIYTNTVKENKKVISFHKNFGATITNKYSIHPVSGYKLRKAYILNKDFPIIKEKNENLIKKIYENSPSRNTNQ